MNVAWGITGAGHLLIESYEMMKQVSEHARVNTFVSRAGEEVLRMYGLRKKLVKISGGGYLEELFLESEHGFSSPKSGRFLLGKYDALVVSPTTSNTVAKIAHGIADTLVTNAVAQAVKGGVPVYIVPVDISGVVDSEMPYSIDRETCEWCPECKPREKCPRGAITTEDNHTGQIDLRRCSGCGMCVELCEHDAIDGGTVELRVRDLDRQNVEILRGLEGIRVLEDPMGFPEALHLTEE